ncbi:RICIN domain-containing protein [Kitasatospora sp. NPDC047058]|uniref:RICIN domain-containing protein n=1 Tax=Kitasatospora sp. NPDC047058 TaxID=3155620 RepID=UPI0033BFD1C0
MADPVTDPTTYPGPAHPVREEPAPRSAPCTRARPPYTDGRRPGGRRALTSLAAVGAGAVVALVIAGVVLTAVHSAGTHRPPAGALTLPGSTESAPSPSATSAGPETVSQAPPAAAPSTVPTVAVTPTPAGQLGAPLVNKSSGLCVGITDRKADSPPQLQPCTGQAGQRWERLAADQDTYQLRNVDTGMCLDGTTAGGDTVVVVVRSCRSGAQRAQQLWWFEPDARTGAVRLWFVPPVPSSEDASHLLGPEHWAHADPTRAGSALVHLPDYYHSSSFLFTLG